MAEELARRKAEREAKRKAKEDEREQKRLADRAAFEKVVLDDPWSQDEQLAFENALLTFTPAIEKYERWTNIAKAVGNQKSPNQCILRYKYLKEYVKLNKQ